MPVMTPRREAVRQSAPQPRERLEHVQRRGQHTHAPQPAANSADDEIVRLVQADAHPERVCVATSDRALAERVQAAGASTFPAERLRNVIDPR